MKEIGARIEELEGIIEKCKKDTEEIVIKSREMQQKVAQNNTEILKAEGGIEELKKQLR